MRNLDKLSIIWDKRQKDFVVKYPRSCDGALILNTICDDVLKFNISKDCPYNFDNFNLVKELEERGYDLTTLKFSVELKKENSIKE